MTEKSHGERLFNLTTQPLTEMKTATELASEMRKFGITTFNRWAIDGAAMLRQQAEQIEHLRLERDALIALSEQVTKERDALKADAERFTTLAEYLVSDRTEYDDAIVDARTVEQLRAAIDAMKGKS